MMPVSVVGRNLRAWFFCAVLAATVPTLYGRQTATNHARQSPVAITVVDENGVPVASAQVTVSLQGQVRRQLRTDYRGQAVFLSDLDVPCEVQAQKPGFYVGRSSIDPHSTAVSVVITHQQQVKQEINVVESIPTIDPQQVADTKRMDTPEIVNIPYPTSRDIRNLLPFNPGVVQDASQQVHVAGSSTYETLDLLDGFDITSPVSGLLTMRFSPDAVRTIDIEKTRYPVEYGRNTGGVIAFHTGMGDDRFRFNATNFVPSVQNKNGWTFDKFVPRATLSGPIRKGKAWFYDGLELEYDNVVITELPNGANSNHLWRGSNLAKTQVNITQANLLTVGFLVNEYHSPSEGLSPLVPQESTIIQNNRAWLAYATDQQTFSNGVVLDLGASSAWFRDSLEPHGTLPFAFTPELSVGSFFGSLLNHARRNQGRADLYLPAQHLAGRHDVKAGIEVDQIDFEERLSLAPVSYLREDRTLLRTSTFAPLPVFREDNLAFGAYVQDRWAPRERLLIEGGMRFDRDQVLGDVLFSPRIAFTYVPRKDTDTKISGGVGIYYDETQLEYLSRVAAGVRSDTYFAPDGITPLGPAVTSTFIVDRSRLEAPYAVNWSLGLEHKLPAAIYMNVNFMEKQTKRKFNYDLLNPVSSLYGTYLLGNSREDHYHSLEVSARHTFSGAYALFGSYTRSSATTNAVLNYFPTPSILGPQARGPLPWDAPNRVLSWGWLPAPKTKRVDFVYSLEWRTGYPFLPVDANRALAGPTSVRFPNYLSFSPGIELRFHLYKYYLGLRGVLENATSHENPVVVNNVVDSPQFGTFSQFQRRALVARIRIIGRK